MREPAAVTPNSSAVTSSTSGYRMEMRPPHERHRPRNHSQERTGTLSRAAIGSSQRGQALPGRTTDRPLGTRATTTLTNDPMHRPSTVASATMGIEQPIGAHVPD